MGTKSWFSSLTTLLSVVVFLFLPDLALAQWAQWDDRVLVSLNAAVTTTSRTISDTFAVGTPVPRTPPVPPFEFGTISTQYDVPKDRSLDGSVAVRLSGSFGLGFGVSTRRGTSPLNVHASLANPLTIHPFREVDGSVDVRHSETAIHLQLVYVVPLRSNLNVAVSAGPSRFSLELPVAQNVVVNEVPPFNTSTLRDVRLATVSGSSWGFHGGVDVSWMFTRHLGIGALARYSYGNIALQPTDRDPFDVDVGGLQLGAGARVVL